MAVGGGGVEALFWRGPVIPGDVASWESPGVLIDGGAGGGGMSIGSAVVGGTAGSVLFINPNNVLAQDNANFFWDDSGLVLKAGTRLQLLANGTFYNAVFPVWGGPIFGMSWFFGYSGNTTLTGYNNTGAGLGPMVLATTCHDNTAVGTFALNIVTTSSFNTAVGVDALGELDFPGHAGGDFNSAFGVSSLHALETGTGNTAIGNRAGQKLGRNLSCDNNTIVGMESFFAPSDGSNNTAIGYRAGYNILSGSNNTLLGGWQATVATINSIIALSDGAGALKLDYNYITSNIWTIQRSTSAAGLHLYNTWDGLAPTTDYERGIFDWNIAANTLTIGTQAGGTGTVRPIAWAGLSNKTPPIGADHLLLLDSTTSDTMKTVLVSDIASGGGMSIGGAVTSGTAGSVLFVGAGPVLAQDNNSFYWDDSFKTLRLGAPSGLIAYNVVDTISSPTNFEAGLFDWIGNVLTIGTSAGGTGTVRDLKFTIQSVDKLDYGVTNAGNWTFGVGTKVALQGATSGTVTVGTSATPSNWTMTLPDTAGTNLYVLQTDGTGITSWAAPGAATMAIGGAVTGGTNLSVLFINPAGVLAQDNPHFTFDPTLNVLNVGDSSDVGAYYLDTHPALFRVPNVLGDNWFEGDAGNFTCTGQSNMGVGFGALHSLTTGIQNAAFGTQALNACTTGSDNFAFGARSCLALTTGDQNVAVGTGALNAVTTGSFNTALGELALFQLVTGNSNIAVGANALQNLGIGGACFGNVVIGHSTLLKLGNVAAGQNLNVAIGDSILENVTTATASVAIGPQIGPSLTSSANDVFVGQACAASMTSSNQNCLIGLGAGYNLTGSCSNNLFLGGWQGPSAALSSKIAISTGQFATNSLRLDFDYISAATWSMSDQTTNTALHIYNTWDNLAPPTNYERAFMGWRTTANVFQIGTEAGGTGALRIVAINGFQKAGAPVAADLPSGTWGLIHDTSGATFQLCYNDAGTLKTVALV